MPAVRIHETAATRELILGDAPLVFGRGREASARIHGDLEVSKEHARLSRMAGGYEIEDLDSRNGVRVNEQLVSKAPLRDGDVIRIGHTRIEFVGDEYEDEGSRLARALARGREADSSPVPRGASRRAKTADSRHGSPKQHVKKRARTPRAARPESRAPTRGPSGPPIAKRAIPVLIFVVAGGLSSLAALRLFRPAAESPPETVTPHKAAAPPTRGAASGSSSPIELARALDRDESEEWPRELIGACLGREPTPRQVKAAERAAEALPPEIAGRLPIASVLSSASRVASRPLGASGVEIRELYEAVLGRGPTVSEIKICLDELRGGNVREAAMAIASLANGRVTEASPAAGATGVVIACAASLGIADLYRAPDRLPNLRRLARQGVLALDLSGAGESPRSAVSALLRGSGGGVLDRVRQASDGETWLVVPDAANWTSLVADVNPGSSQPIRLWSAEIGSHPAVRGLVSAFGRPAPLGDAGWERVRRLRSALGEPLSELEFELARGIAPRRGSARLAIDSYVEALLRTRRPRLLVAVVASKEIDEDPATEVATRLENLAAELLPTITRRRGWLCVVSPGGGAGRGGLPEPGFALAAGSEFRSGRVLAGPHSLTAIQASLSRALRLPGAEGKAIQAMFRK